MKDQRLDTMLFRLFAQREAELVMSLEEEKKVVEEERREVSNGKDNATCISAVIVLLRSWRK